MRPLVLRNAHFSTLRVHRTPVNLPSSRPPTLLMLQAALASSTPPRKTADSQPRQHLAQLPLSTPGLLLTVTNALLSMRPLPLLFRLSPMALLSLRRPASSLKAPEVASRAPTSLLTPPTLQVMSTSAGMKSSLLPQTGWPSTRRPGLAPPPSPVLSSRSRLRP